MSKPYLWTYWEGEKPCYIEQCLKSFYIHNSAYFTIKILTKEEIKNSLCYDLDINRLPISQKVDCLRIALLYQYGGIWIDADTLIIKPLEGIYGLLEDNDFLGIQWDTGKISNGYFAMKKHSQMGKELLKITINKIKNVVGNNLRLIKDYPWVYFGEETFKDVLPKYQTKFLSRKVFVPVNFPFLKSCNIFFQPGNIKNYIEKNTKAIALNYSCFKKSYPDDYNKTKKYYLNSNTLLSSIVKLGEEIERTSKKI